MNFNFNDESAYDSEYDLLRSCTEEQIDLYGVPVKYIITEKVNQDDIFGEHSHIKIDNEAVYPFNVTIDNKDNWDGGPDIFSKFGLQSIDTISIFVARSNMEVIHPEISNRDGKASVENLPNGNLVVFGNNKIMEVTNFELTTADFGNNNAFTTDRAKNVYKLTLKSYIYNHDEAKSAKETTESETFEYEDFGNLESIFNEESAAKEEIETRSNTVIPADEVIYPSEVRKKPVRDKEKETNPFGDFG